MPTRLCCHTTPPCPNPAVYRGRCTTHSRAREKQTHKNKAFYNTKRWRMLRRQVLFDQPICAHCDDALATDVDHIKPIEQGGSTWDRANLQPLCTSCHSTKTRQEQA